MDVNVSDINAATAANDTNSTGTYSGGSTGGEPKKNETAEKIAYV